MIGTLRIVETPSRSLALADAPALEPVVKAYRPETVVLFCIVWPLYVVPAGLPRTNRDVAGAVSVPSGLIVHDLLISKSSKNGPQSSWVLPRTEYGHQLTERK